MRQVEGEKDLVPEEILYLVRLRCYLKWDGVEGIEKASEIHTWLVQTLLKVTKAKVWASIVLGRSFFARMRGIATAERKIWGMKASFSRLNELGSLSVMEEERYKRVL